MKNLLLLLSKINAHKNQLLTISLLICINFCFNNSTKAQLPDSILSITDTNYFQITSKVDAYLTSLLDTSGSSSDSIDEEEEDSWQANYARWKYNWANKIDRNGMFAEYYKQLDYYENNKELLRNSCAYNNPSEDFTWKCLGPFQTIVSGSQHQGQINAISVNANNESDILVGTYNGGIWKSSDGGAHWKNTTDGTTAYDNQGTQCIERMPLDQNIVFATTCKNNVGRWVGIDNIENKSVSKGIITSSNGGETWNSIPLITYSYESLTKIPQLIVHPLSTPGHALVIFIEESNTFFTTIKLYDEYNNTVSVLVGFEELAYKKVAKIAINPTNPFLLYVSTKNEFFSTSSAKLYRVTLNNSPVLHAVTGSIVQQDFSNLNSLCSSCGFVDDASLEFITFSFANNGTAREVLHKKDGTLDIFAKINSDLTFVSGQVFFHSDGFNSNRPYFAVSPDNDNVLYKESGFQPVKSIDGGNTFSSIGNTGHSDTRFFEVVKSYNSDPSYNRDVIYCGNDGGISRSSNSGNSFNLINGIGLNIGEYYGLGGTEQDVKFIRAGAQDGALNNFQNNVWTLPLPLHLGDNGEQIIQPDNINHIRFSGNYLYRQNWGTCLGINGEGSDVKNHYRLFPFSLSKVNSSRVFIGFENLHMRDESTSSPICDQIIWTNPQNNPISAIETSHDAGVDIVNLAQSGYTGASSTGGIWQIRPSSGGWLASERTNNLRSVDGPLNHSSQINDIAVDPNDPNRMWICLGGLYSSLSFSPTELHTHKVYRTINGGATWTEYSEGLPNLPTYTIEYQKETNDRLYLGTDIGVYYREAGMNCWVRYGKDMPDVMIYDIDINYCGNRLRVASYGRGIWEVPLLLKNEMLISTNTTWNTSRDINTNVHITRGVGGASTTLTIIGSTSNPADLMISMVADKKIIIDKGCKLIVKNASITNSCNAMWEGIEVDGGASGQVLSSNDNLTNISCNQGFVYLENAIIENAHEAIKMINNPATTICGGVLHDASGMYGGIIRAVNSTFKNNRRSAEFLIYRNIPPGSMVEQKNLSFFKNCTFTTNDNHRIDHSFHAHVTMWGTYGIEFLGCTFENAVSSPPRDARDLGDGIYAIDANFSVKNLIVDQNKFTGLNRGIQVENSDNSVGFSVQNTIFENDVRCLGATNSNFARSRFNSFSLGNYHGGIGNYYVQSAQFDFYGNLFTKPSTTSTSFYAGSWFWNSSKTNISDHISSNNRYSNLPWGSLCNYTNRIPFGSKGLQFICNENTNNLHDFTVFNWSDISDLAYRTDGIKQNQGNASFRSGNTFSSSIATGTTNQFTQEQDNSVYCYCKTSAGDCPDAAKVTAAPRFNVVAIFASNACALKDYQPTTSTGGSGAWSGIQKQKMTQQELVDATAAFNLAKTNYNYYNQLLQTLIDGGNTDEVVYQVNNSSAKDIATLRSYLLGFSPYLSETAFIEALKPNILPNAILFEIISNNPTLSKQLSLVDTLSTKPDPFPQWMIDYIMANTNAITFRSTLEYSIDINHQEMMQQARDIIMDMDYEADSFDHATYRNWLLSLNDAESDYMVIDNYINNSMFSEASQLLEDITTKYDLKGKQEEDYNSYLSFANWKIDVLSNNGSMDSLTENQKSNLQTIADTGMALGNMKARNVLNFFYDGTYEVMPEVPIENNNQRRGNTQKLQNVNLENNYIKVYPNPSKDIVYVTFNIPCINKNASLKMIDLNGIIIYNKTIIEGIKQDVIDVSKWSAGAYQYVLECDGAKIASDKLVIIK